MANAKPGVSRHLLVIVPIGIAVLAAAVSFVVLRDEDDDDTRALPTIERSREPEPEPVALAIPEPPPPSPVAPPPAPDIDAGADDPQLARQQAIDAARSAGVLGVLKADQGGAFASITGTGDISSGFDDTDIYGGLLGNEAGEAAGGFTGSGLSGSGPGGGGTGWGTLGTGRYGTLGGSGAGQGYGVGGGRGGMRGRSDDVPQVRIGQPDAHGDLDKAIIRRYIKRSIAKIRYCYEKQLLAQPQLQGTVTSQFVISPNGTVSSSTATGMDDEVAGCVADVIRAIEFPKPQGGGSVSVRYPFTFRPDGN